MNTNKIRELIKNCSVFRLGKECSKALNEIDRLEEENKSLQRIVNMYHGGDMEDYDDASISPSSLVSSTKAEVWKKIQESPCHTEYDCEGERHDWYVDTAIEQAIFSAGEKK